MRRLVFVVLAAVVPLALAAPAGAKEPVKAKVCGKSDCVETKDRGALAAFTEGGPPSEPPSPSAAWYRVRMTIDIGDGNTDSFPMVVAPGAQVMGSAAGPDGPYEWFELSEGAASAYARLIAGVEPLAAADLPGVDLRAGTPEAARVDEVVEPPPATADSSGAAVWPWLLAAAGIGVAGFAAVRFARHRRARRPGGQAASQALSRS